MQLLLKRAIAHLLQDVRVSSLVNLEGLAAVRAPRVRDLPHVVHELTHALQDQHFAVGKLQDAVETNAADAALLGVLEGAAPDPDDPATTTCPRPPGGDYTRFLDRSALRGARIGVPRAYFYDAVVSGGSATPRGGLTPPQRAVMEDAITELRRLGVVVVDPANIPSVVDADPQRNFLDCVKSRRLTVANAEVMYRSMSTVHAANICMWLKRDLKFDPEKAEFVNDPEANRWLTRELRKPWTYDLVG